MPVAGAVDGTEVVIEVEQQLQYVSVEWVGVQRGGGDVEERLSTRW